LFSLWEERRTSASLPELIEKALATPGLQATGVDLASALGDPRYAPALMTLARSAQADASLRAAAVDAVAGFRDPRHVPDLDALAASGPPAVRTAAVHALGLIAPPDIEAKARAVVLSDAPNEARAEAVRILSRTATGLDTLVELDTAALFPAELKRLAASLVRGPVRRAFGRPGGAAPGTPAGDAEAAAFAAARERAAKAFPAAAASNAASIPTIHQMEQTFRVDAVEGRKVFDTLCAACHSVGGARQMGPDLSAIATKLDRQALLDAIVMPSAAIAFGYESWVMETSRGTVTGLLVEDTPARIALKVDATQEVRLMPSEIVSRRPVPVSVMPEGLVNAMTPQQIVDLIGFLSTLTGAPDAARR
jgi:putative heme-binding domain-containing protein